MRSDQRRLRARRRRRRMVRGAVRTVFWAFVLAGVFIMGIGYGKTLSGEDELRSDDVSITLPSGSVEATLPTRTVTVTKTVTTPARATTRAGGGGTPAR